MDEKILIEIVSKYDISYTKISKIIDSSRPDDYRLNIILDDNYVVRINNKNSITEERLSGIERLICRYNEIGVNAPHYLKNIAGTYSIIIDDKICYVSEYANYALACDLELEPYMLRKESIAHLGVLASKYTNYDLVETKSMWSIIDLAPLDIDIDEKQENLNSLVEELTKIGQVELAIRINEFNNVNRQKIINVFDQLPRCVYQGDLNDSNILIKDNKFYGLIDFNMSGTEVNINCFLSETDRGILPGDFENYSAKEILDNMINYQNELLKIVLKEYQLNDFEKEVFENYRNIILISQYPNVCSYIYYLDSTYKESVLELLRLIINRKKSILC